MTTKKITLKFSLGDKVYSKSHQEPGIVTEIEYREWGASAKHTLYKIRFGEDQKVYLCRESDLALAGLESDEFVDLEAEANK